MGNNSKQIIDINGKRYDAVSGAFLGDSSMAPIAKATASRPSVARSVDGFRTTPAALAPQTHHAAAHTPKRKPHTPGIDVTAHRPQAARTLMRTAVRKPEIKSPAVIKAQTRTDILARAPKQVVAPKVSHSSVDPRRLKKATQMVKSPVVSHYAPQKAIPTGKPVTPYAFRAPTTPRAMDTFSTPAHKPATATPAAFPAIAVSAEKQHTRQPDIFEQALARARSHDLAVEDSRPTGKKGRIAGILTATLSLLFIAGAIAYMNAPTLSMHLASMKAGFAAKLPSYSPAGYAFGHLTYSPGNITVSYKAASNHTFNITQRQSTWDSEALLNNFVSNANQAYQTYERAGRTIYFYGNDTATWVDSGVWYTINGNNSLDKNQLLDMASSM